MNEYKVPKLNQWEINNNELYLEKGYNKAKKDMLEILKIMKDSEYRVNAEKQLLIDIMYSILDLEYTE